MKALRFYAPEDVRLEDVPEPECGPAEVKIKVNPAPLQTRDTGGVFQHTAALVMRKRFGERDSRRRLTDAALHVDHRDNARGHSCPFLFVHNF